MKKLNIKFLANDLVIFQTIVVEKENISVSDVMEGLNNQDYLTTTWHDRKYSNYKDVEIIDRFGERIGYVESQRVEDVDKYRDFEIVK